VARDGDRVLGYVGEVDAELQRALTNVNPRRLGVLDLDLDVLFELVADARKRTAAQVPGRFPSALVDLAFVTPDAVHAEDLAHALRGVDADVEDVTLFDVYRGGSLPAGTRSLAYAVRLSSNDGTLGEKDIATLRQRLIDEAAAHGATLRA
jgi:phenylalanyl-tRNA synthetase beta chain